MDYFRTKISVLFLLLVVAPCLPAPACGIKVTDDIIGVTTSKCISFKCLTEPIDALIKIYMDVLKTVGQYLGLPLICGPPPPQGPPRRWIAFDLQGRVPGDRARVLTRDDSMLLAGFANKSGHYHAFADDGTGLVRLDLPLPGAMVVATTTARGFTDVAAAAALPTLLPLSKELFLDDVHTLANYPHVAVEDFETAVKRVNVMLLDAARIKQVRSRVADIWESGSEGHLEPVLAQYGAQWSNMSMLLFCAEQNFSFAAGAYADALKSIGVYTAEDVKSILGVVFQPAGFDPERSCKP